MTQDRKQTQRNSDGASLLRAIEDADTVALLDAVDARFTRALKHISADGAATFTRALNAKREHIAAGPWVDFGDVAYWLCGMQSQYCSRYIDGRHEHEEFGAGLRFRRRRPSHAYGYTVDATDYHNIVVHADDATEFARRVNDHRRATRQIA